MISTSLGHRSLINTYFPSSTRMWHVTVSGDDWWRLADWQSSPHAFVPFFSFVCVRSSTGGRSVLRYDSFHFYYIQTSSICNYVFISFRNFYIFSSILSFLCPTLCSSLETSSSHKFTFNILAHISEDLLFDIIFFVFLIFKMHNLTCPGFHHFSSLSFYFTTETFHWSF